MDVQQGLFDQKDVLPLTKKEMFEHCWSNLTIKSRKGFDKGETSERIYKPFYRMWFLDTGGMEYFLSNRLPEEYVETALRAVADFLDTYPLQTLERDIRTKCSAYEKEEEELNAYKKLNGD